MTITYEYDNIGNVERVLKNGTPIYSCELDADMQLIHEQDYMADSETQYFYTAAGELYLTRKTLGDNVILSYTITDDETGKSDYVTEINGTKLTYSSVYDEETEFSKYILPNLEEITSDTDDFGRTKNVYLKDSEGNTLLSYTYTYVDKTVDGTVRTSEYVASITYSNGKAFSYTYDANGKITSVSDGTYTTSYVYDNLGQLTRENSQKLNKTWVYSYDTAGNILSKSVYAYTTEELGTATSTVAYGYTNSNWGDQLTSYNGTAITYDSLGNPLNWTNGKAFTWEGRQLKSVSNGTYVYTYEYNADGIRTKTTVTKPADPDYSEVYEYILDDNGNVVQIKLNGSVHATFYYDESGSPIGYTNNKYTLWYTKNQQGDIVRVESDDGTVYADYEYDAWGNATVEYNNLKARLAIGKFNIFTYRGYIYDTQTGFYYLQSRYYDPAVGRFLNADAVDYLGATGTVLGYNLYAYCENNAIKYVDTLGFGPWSRLLNVIDYNMIHRKVADLSAWSIGGFLASREVYVLNGKKIGFLDIYDILNHASYEVKSSGASNKKSTKDQMTRYDNSIHPPVWWKGKIARGKKYVSGAFYYGAWKVTYERTIDGLIVYKCTWMQSRYDSMKRVMGVSLAFASVSAVVVISVSSGGTIPAYLLWI